MTDKHYEVFTTYACPKCGWSSICIYDNRRWIKEYNKRRDVVYWTCPDCGFMATKSIFQVLHQIDTTEEVHDKEAFDVLSKRLNAEISGSNPMVTKLFVSLDEYALILRAVLKECKPGSTVMELSFQGVLVEVAE